MLIYSLFIFKPAFTTFGHLGEAEAPVSTKTQLVCSYRGLHLLKTSCQQISSYTFKLLEFRGLSLPRFMSGFTCCGLSSNIHISCRFFCKISVAWHFICSTPVCQSCSFLFKASSSPPQTQDQSSAERFTTTYRSDYKPMSERQPWWTPSSGAQPPALISPLQVKWLMDTDKTLDFDDRLIKFFFVLWISCVISADSE